MSICLCMMTLYFVTGAGSAGGESEVSGVSERLLYT